MARASDEVEHNVDPPGGRWFSARDPVGFLVCPD
jgi:hypothetical protein